METIHTNSTALNYDNHPRTIIFFVSTILIPVEQMDGCCCRMASLGQHGTHRPRLLEQEVTADENILNYCAPTHLKLTQLRTL